MLDLVADVRATLPRPIVLFSTPTRLLRLGFEAFADRAAAAGVDGVLLLDLPIEEAGDVLAPARCARLDTIFLLSPTTTPSGSARPGASGAGSSTRISRLGVTGVRDQIAEGAEALAARMRRECDLPLAMGFGISRPEHVAAVGGCADAAVVGSALVR